MKKFLKIKAIFFGTVILLLIGLQFTGFIGNVSIGKQKNDLKSEHVTSFENSPFKNEVLDSGKLTCLNIWATWCVPCLAVMPEMNTLKKEFENKDVQFISLSIDTDSFKLKKFIAQDKFDFRDITLANKKYRNAILNFLENRPLNADNQSQVIPLTYLVKNGKVVEKIEGGIDSGDLKKQIGKHM